jgi:pyrimidine operon attenuation protein / uracil phosphoribosyltransferase
LPATLPATTPIATPLLPDAEQLLHDLCAALGSEIAATGRTVHLIGVHSGGAWIAERLHGMLGLKTPLGFLSSAFHRDDFGARGLARNPKSTQLPFDIQDADIVLVDDVLYTGRTVRASLNELFDHGRAKRIELAVLVDRGGRELPVAARYVGISLALEEKEELVLSQDTTGRLSLKLESCATHN